MATCTGLAKHLLACYVGVHRLQFPLQCPFCDAECQKRDGLSKHSVACYSWEQDTSSDDQLLGEFNKELIRVTRHRRLLGTQSRCLRKQN
ncbi:MAG: hypothetical protein BYD32DRAFT_417494 [Podila humilis]|nr:MAG: hypothetical protein BYD32DRAFT_417494 [Podila humilis]